VRLTERDFNKTVTAFPKLEAGSNKLNSMQKLFDITEARESPSNCQRKVQASKFGRPELKLPKN